MRIRPGLVALFALLSTYAVSAADLELTGADLAIRMTEGGYILSVRALPDIGSVLLTESTEDPARQAASFALRSPVEHPLLAGEQRLLNGDVLNEANTAKSIISSSIRPHERLGEAFELFIPETVVYGYPWSREGSISVGDGTWLSVRTFALPYGDYSGTFRDNPFRMRVSFLERPPEPEPEPEPVVEPEPEPEPEVRERIVEARPDDDRLDEDAIREFRRLARATDGDERYVLEADDLIAAVLDPIEDAGPAAEVVLVIDTTGSMGIWVDTIREQLPTAVDALYERTPDLAVGITLFKDYFSVYLNRVLPFEHDAESIRAILENVSVGGGGDIPEAVHEALYAAIHGYDWATDERHIVLIGDAPPHPRPRGNITFESVVIAAAEHEVRIHTILLPPDRQR